MSFVVKGADYPKCCAECYAGLDYSGDCPVCRFTGEQRGYTFNTRNRKMDKCPLHDLPTPHGKLIDAKKLISSLAETEEEFEIDDNNVLHLIIALMQVCVDGEEVVIDAEE